MPDTGFYSDLANAAFEAMGAGMVVVGESMEVIALNRVAADLAKETPEALRGRPVAEVLGDGFAEVEWLFPVVLRTGQSRHTSLGLVDENGKRRHFRLAATPIAGPAIRVLLELNEITDYNRDLMKSVQNEKMAAVGLLAAGIAHEFNNIWASVSGFAELAKDDTSFAKELVEIILTQSSRAEEVIQALLSFSDNRVALRRGVQIGAVLKAIERVVNLELQARGIKMELTIDEDPQVNGNEGMLQQIFLNLVTNAYQAIHKEGRISIQLCREGDWAVVRVRDTGEGMSKEQLRHIFEPFFTTKGSFGGSQEEEGHGLGLAMVYNMVRVHGGEIHAESEPGKGSVFTVRVPVSTVEPEAPHEPPTRELERRGFAGKRMLVVEDEALLHGLLQRIFAEMEVVCCETGEAGVQQVRNADFDVAIVDLVLGGQWTGAETVTRLLKRKPQLPIVCVTGRPTDAESEPALSQARSLVRKPFSMSEIRGAVAKAIWR